MAKDRQGIFPAQVCFHAQQAAEKALKAVLLFHRIDFPLVHDIEILLDLSMAGGIELPSEVREAGVLTPYVVESRYPGHAEEIVTPDVEAALTLAERVLRWATQVIGM